MGSGKASGRKMVGCSRCLDFRDKYFGDKDVQPWSVSGFDRLYVGLDSCSCDRRRSSNLADCLGVDISRINGDNQAQPYASAARVNTICLLGTWKKKGINCCLSGYIDHYYWLSDFLARHPSSMGACTAPVSYSVPE